MYGLIWLLVAVLLTASMTAAACNYALRSLNRMRLEEELARRNRIELLESTLRRRGELMLTTGLLRVLLNVTAILALIYAHRHWIEPSPLWRGAIVGLLAFALIVVFVVGVSTAWARYAGELLLAQTLAGLHLARRVLGPLVGVLHGIDELVRRLSGAPRQSDPEARIQRQIMSAVAAGEREGVVAAEEKDMIRSVLRFQDTRVGQIMTPRTDMAAVDIADGLDKARQTVAQAGHSRIPVYQDNLDNVIGVLNARDLLAAHAEHSAGGGDLRAVMRTPFFVPQSKPLGDLLGEFRKGQVHLAIVLDEFGGTAGLVTIEDILEEIVGEIADEHEQPEPTAIRQVEPNVYDLDGRVHVSDLNEKLGLALPEDEDYDTVSGLVISKLGRIPAAGETVRQDGVTITVTDAEPRRIKRLRLHIVAGEPSEPA